MKKVLILIMSITLASVCWGQHLEIFNSVELLGKNSGQAVAVLGGNAVLKSPELLEVTKSIDGVPVLVRLFLIDGKIDAVRWTIEMDRKELGHCSKIFVGLIELAERAEWIILDNSVSVDGQNIFGRRSTGGPKETSANTRIVNRKIRVSIDADLTIGEASVKLVIDIAPKAFVPKAPEKDAMF